MYVIKNINVDIVSMEGRLSMLALDSSLYKVLAIIPARGGSKGIRRKNIRFVASNPLIYYPIATALQSKYIDDVYVTSDDDVILRVANIFSAKGIKRPPELAKDDVPLDPVVYHAVSTLEEQYGKKYDIIITLQPTVPLITAEDLDNALEMMVKQSYDTVVFASEATHLYWIESSSGWRPLLNIRANRQYLPKIAKELGVIITWRRHLKENSRFGPKIGLYLVPGEKGVDIDTRIDMLIAEVLLKRYNIMFIVEGGRKTGLGHIYRCLTLAERLHGHNIIVLTNSTLGEEILRRWGYSVRILRSLEEAANYASTCNPHIIGKDILDTTKEYMELLRKSTDALIVNFEDLGEGMNYADVVFNALYEFSSPPQNHYYGYKYFVLRDEFRLFPIKEYTAGTKLRTLTVIFGGVDLNNLTMKTLEAIEKLGLKNIDTRVIVGPGYMYLDKLKHYIDELLENDFKITLYSSPDFIADVIYSSELVVTSNGRTLYEVISYAIPVISIAQNERELKHPFAHINKGVKFLGMARNINSGTIADALDSFIQNPKLLVNYNKLLIPYAKDLRKGIKRVLRIIFDLVEEHDKD